MKLTEKMRLLEADHSPDGWPAVQMRDVTALVDEIERLTVALSKANASSERFERGWYLRGEALEKIEAWADAYPLQVFPEPDFARAHELLAAGGMTLDAISASNMRHVVTGVRKLAKSGLDS